MPLTFFKSLRGAEGLLAAFVWADLCTEVVTQWWPGPGTARLCQHWPMVTPGSRLSPVTSDIIWSFQLPSRFQSQRVKLNIDLSLITGSLSSRDFGCGATFHETFHYDGDCHGSEACVMSHCHGNRKLLPGHVTQIYFDGNIFGDKLRWWINFRPK